MSARHIVFAIHARECPRDRKKTDAKGVEPRAVDHHREGLGDRAAVSVPDGERDHRGRIEGEVPRQVDQQKRERLTVIIRQVMFAGVNAARPSAPM
jgi:hypothetical protein